MHGVWEEGGGDAYAVWEEGVEGAWRLKEGRGHQASGRGGGGTAKIQAKIIWAPSGPQFNRREHFSYK